MMLRYLSFSFLLFLNLTVYGQASLFKTQKPFAFTSIKSVRVSGGVVVAAHPLASEAGRLILEKGGNAVDAVIATQWALAVVYPGAGNLGGGGFMVARLQNGKKLALDYREMAPAAAFKDMYLDSSGNPDARKSLYGHLSCGVPGTVAGLFAAHQYGKLPMKILIAPAIELAEKGYAITAAEARNLNSTREEFIKCNTIRPVFVKNEDWKAGDILIQKDLAATLKRISQLGAAGFYEGETAEKIVAEMYRGKGLISFDDLKNYKAKWRPAQQFDYRGYHIVSMPMPSSGGVLLCQMLKMIEPFDIGKMGFQTPASVQLMIEAERRAYADRARYMGDPDFYKVPVAALTSDSYIQSRMKDYRPDRAGSSKQVREGVVPGYESEETTHISVIDNQGNAVAVTTTLNNNYGSKTVVAGAGFLLNDEMDDFSAKPGTPNFYGAVGGKANAIEPGKRMLSSMTPTLVLKDNQPYLVVGTPGGTTIPTSVFQSIVNIIDFGLSPSDAVNQPKFHHQWLPDEVSLERGFSATTAKALEKMGYELRSRGGIGRTELIKVLPDGSFEAIADSRGDDSAAGW
ncbi:gamma-glutamyltransferase [Niabella terrae]